MKTRASLTERKGLRLKQNQTSTQRKLTPTNSRVMRKNISVNMVSKRSNQEQKAKEKISEEPSIPVKESDLEAPDQSIAWADGKRRNQHCRRTGMQQNRKRKQ